jgi:multimeric flavodoxin WrbA
MLKNILILNGSPREKGNSAMLANHVAEGARELGANVESIVLHRLDIRACDACDECAGTGVCVIKDDMQSLYPKVANADAIVLASPIYWFTYSAQMKLCIDRLYAFQNTHWKELEGKPFGIVLVYGDSDPYDAGVANAIHAFESMCRFLKADIVGIVHGMASELGDAEKNPDLIKRARELGKCLAV